MILVFDADDTLWDNQCLYEKAERHYCQVLAQFASEADIRKALFAVESRNMPLMGYGTKAFVISLMENALEVSHGQLTGSHINEILQIGFELLHNPATPLSGVEQTLSLLHSAGKWRMICFTKGELLDQENKFQRSGLAPYFDHLEIASDKSTDDYLSLCRKMNAGPEELLMIGNSFKSDIHPVLQLGGAAIHVPYHTTWQYEHTDEYTHPRLRTLSSFSDIPAAITELTSTIK